MTTKIHETKVHETKTYEPTQNYDEIQEQSLNLVRQGQEAVVEGFRAWSEALGSFAPAWQATGWPVRPEEAVDAVFDIAEQTLATQRQVARQLWGATASMADTAAKQSATAAKQTPTVETRAPSPAAQTAEPQAPTAETQGRTAEPAADRSKGKDYESMTVEQLQDEAAKADIEGRSQMNKQELVKALRKHR